MKMCKIIDGSSPGSTKLSRVFAAASLYYNYSQSEKCFHLENQTDEHGLHGWDWQVKILMHNWFSSRSFQLMRNKQSLGMYRDGYANSSLKWEHVSSISIQLQRLCRWLHEDLRSKASSALDHYWIWWRSEYSTIIQKDYIFVRYVCSFV